METKTQQLAIELHKAHCKGHNGRYSFCRWHSECRGDAPFSHDWDRDAHQLWHTKASDVIEMSLTHGVTVVTLCEIMKDVKPIIE
jgi:hypothetical protein